MRKRLSLQAGQWLPLPVPEPQLFAAMAQPRRPESEARTQASRDAEGPRSGQSERCPAGQTRAPRPPGLPAAPKNMSHPADRGP